MMAKFALALLVAVAAVSEAQGKWSFEISTGSAHNFSTDLTIQQSGAADLKFDADYETKAFQTPFYYAWRVGRWKGSRGWEVELVHHKVTVTNNPSEVQHFEVSHGYNLLLLNHAWKYNGLLFHVGGGVVVAHPETIVRGISAEPGYEFTGPAAQAAVGRRFYFANKFFLSVEGKFTAARARVSVANGEAKVPNVAIHGLFGFGLAP